MAELIKPYRIGEGKRFRLKHIDPSDTGNLQIEKTEAKEMLQDGINRLSDLQQKLYAQDRWALLLIF